MIVFNKIICFLPVVIIIEFFNQGNLGTYPGLAALSDVIICVNMHTCTHLGKLFNFSKILHLSCKGKKQTSLTNCYED